jgi:hypothetical protein
MSDRLTPPEKIPPDDWLKVQRIERDKLSKEEENAKAKDKSPRPLLFAAFVIYFRKIINSLFPNTQDQIGTVDMQRCLEDLKAFKKMLQTLGNEDQSRNPEFIQQLSKLWHNLIDDCNILNISLHKNAPQTAELNEFINTLNQYPPKEDHTLGYYLTEYVGGEWLPFPFMEMLSSLHAQHQKNPESSEISKWIGQINTLLDSANIQEES